MQSSNFDFNDLNGNTHSFTNQNKIKNNFNCIEAAKDNKQTIKKIAQYFALAIILGYCICDIVDIETNKKNPNKEAKIEEKVAIACAILSTAAICFKAFFDIKRLNSQETDRSQRFIEIPQSPTPLESAFLNYWNTKKQRPNNALISSTDYDEL